ncbi:MAG: hypothetical protein HRT88_09875 [Lentisphaeraceae bacterium]|nr:hypothetical protein [Lentisphaeraceae bacterium]
MDWGLAVGQELENYEYEMSLTMGSGMRWTHRDDSYAFSGRIGLPNGSYYGAGISLCYGDVIKGKGVIERHLVALDGEYYIDSFSLGVEVYGGEINERDTIGGLASINWRNTDETLLIYQQYEYHNTQTMPDYHCLKAGLSYRFTKNINCSFQAISELNNSREDFLQFQIRYRF